MTSSSQNILRLSLHQFVSTVLNVSEALIEMYKTALKFSPQLQPFYLGEPSHTEIFEAVKNFWEWARDFLSRVALSWSNVLADLCQARTAIQLYRESVGETIRNKNIFIYKQMNESLVTWATSDSPNSVDNFHHKSQKNSQQLSKQPSFITQSFFVFSFPDHIENNWPFQLNLARNVSQK